MPTMRQVDRVLNEVFARLAPPMTRDVMAQALRALDHHEVAAYIAALPESVYDDIRWDIEVRQINEEDSDGCVPCQGDGDVLAGPLGGRRRCLSCNGSGLSAAGHRKLWNAVKVEHD